jgi:hypothetical protein
MRGLQPHCGRCPKGLKGVEEGEQLGEASGRGGLGEIIFTVLIFPVLIMGVWQGVAMDSLKFHPGLSCSVGGPPLYSLTAVSGVACP